MQIVRGARITALLLAVAGEALAQARNSDGATLRRRAQWGASLTPTDTGALVRRVVDGSPAARAGLRAGDRVVALNGQPMRGIDDYSRASQAVRGGDSVRVRVVRASAPRDTVLVRFVVDSVPHEQIRGTSVVYGSVRSDRGYRVRTVVTRPERAATGRLPAVLFIPWLSCDPIEQPEPGNDGFAHMLRDVAGGSGMLSMRVEKPGVGDSEGPDCGDTRLEDDLDAFRAALRTLRAMPDVDTTKVFLLGGSIGGALAPILGAEGAGGIAGVIAVNGFSRTWYEHMLDIERRRLTLAGQKPAEVNAAMRGFAQFYTRYLLEARTPAEVLAASPELRPLWDDEPTRQYGRLAAYYHAVQRLDVENAWAMLASRRIPSLVVWGEYDWIMSRAEADRAAEIVNTASPGLSRLVILPKTDHGLMVFESAAAAFARQQPRYDGGAGRAINGWLQEQVRAR